MFPGGRTCAEKLNRNDCGKRAPHQLGSSMSTHARIPILKKSSAPEGENEAAPAAEKMDRRHSCN